MAYRMTGFFDSTTNCFSSCLSAGVKQSMSLPTARRTAAPVVGVPGGTTALTCTRFPSCSSSSKCSATEPASQCRMAASNAALGSTLFFSGSCRLVGPQLCWSP